MYFSVSYSYIFPIVFTVFLTNVDSEQFNITSIREKHPGFGIKWFYLLDDRDAIQKVQIKNDPEAPATLSESILDLPNNIQIGLYTRNNPNKTLVSMQDNSLTLSTFDSSKPVKIITHGILMNGDTTCCIILKDAFLRKYDLNVFILDWGHFSETNYYLTAITYCKPIGYFCGDFIEFLIKNGVDPKTIHLIGSCLGAHLLGYTGKYLCAKGLSVARITGLDPIGIYFRAVSNDQKLVGDDADFVDVIHTSNLGIGTPIGHVNFYCNNGSVQPGCEKDFNETFGGCSHSKACRYFADSLISSIPYMACNCTERKEFWKGKECLDPTPMGDGTPDIARGKFCLRTKRDFPYALGWDSTFEDAF